MLRHRLFFGLEPSPDLQARVESATHGLPVQGVTGSQLVPPEKRHVTLAFLGDIIDSTAVGRACAAGAAVATPAFDFVLDRACSFGHIDPLWVLAGEPHPFAPLRSALVKGLHEQGLRTRDESRAFLPHLTWLRNAGAHLPRTPIPPIRWPVREFLLYDSRQGRYEVLARWPLA